jgi:hypothetical protein
VAAVGAGTTLRMQTDRGSIINVVADDSGLIPLVDEDDDNVIQTVDDELGIDFDPDDNGAGVNVDSRYQVGEFSAVNKAFVRLGGFLLRQTWHVINNSVFSIANNDASKHVIDVTYESIVSYINYVYIANILGME